MQFQLKVMREGVAPRYLALEAANSDEARQLAEQQGYLVLQTSSGAGLPGIRRGSRFPLGLFCQELRVLIEAGLSLTEALDTLAEKETQSTHRHVLERLLVLVREGKPLSDAMAESGSAFPSLFIATVRASETTGNLPEAFSRYGQYLEQVDILKKRIVSASIYPALVLAFGGLVLIFLMGYVVPRFSKIYESHASHVSMTTEWLLALGAWSERYGWLFLAVLTTGIIGLILVLSQPATRSLLLDLSWKLPYFGERVRVYHLARLYRTFSMLLKSGIPLVQGLGMVHSLMGRQLEHQLNRAKRLISEGQTFSEAFASCQLTTAVSARLFRVGERTGKLEGMMERAAAFHEEQMMRWVDAFTKVFEPLLMAAIGIVIGGIVLLMYFPIFELASGLE